MAYKQGSFTPELARELIAKHGSAGAAADAVVGECEGRTGGKVRRETVRFWLQDAAAGRVRADILARSHEDKLNRIAELLERSNIPLEAIGKIKKVKLAGWGQGVKMRQKDGTHRYEKHGLYSTGIELSPSWDEGPVWPVVQPAAPVKIAFAPPKPRTKGMRIGAIFGDEQFGFLRNPDTGSLLPMHDEAALDVVVQVLADLHPDFIGHLGDLLDLSEMSKYLQVEEFFRTTQPAIERAYRFLADCEAAAGDPSKREPTFFIKGNHERRLAEYVQKNARASFRLRPAMETPESWPQNSLQRLLHFDKLGIEDCGEFPGGQKWLLDDLVVMHRPPGKKFDFDASVICGDIHRRSMDPITRQTRSGQKVYTLYTIPALCRMDTNPDGLSLMRTRVASDRGYTSWQQGLSIVYIDKATKSHQVVPVDIIDGKAIFNGRVYSARKRAA